MMTAAVGHNETALMGEGDSIMQTEPGDLEEEPFNLKNALLEGSPEAIKEQNSLEEKKLSAKKRSETPEPVVLNERPQEHFQD